MTAYLMFLREGPVQDADAMAAYQGHNRANPAPIPAKPLVVYGKIEALEGQAPDGMVVLEFPDAATARAWYDSAEYQAGIPLRQKAANYRAMLVEGFSMPTG
jgi:uncharacterized protein (DUF1330 family)